MKHVILILLVAMSTMVGCTKNVATFKIFPRSETPNFEQSDLELIAQISTTSKISWNSTTPERRDIKISFVNADWEVVGNLDISIMSDVEPEIEGYWSAEDELVFTAIVTGEADNILFKSMFELNLDKLWPAGPE